MSARDIRQKCALLLDELELTDQRDVLVEAPPLRLETETGLLAQHLPRAGTLCSSTSPTGGVDPVTRRRFWELIYKAADRGITRIRHHTLHGRGRVLRRPVRHHGRRQD